MSFSKAADLLRVAEMAMSRFDGIALQDITTEFGCDHRTAQGKFQWGIRNSRRLEEIRW